MQAVATRHMENGPDMKPLLRATLLTLIFFGTPLHADPQGDADYIVSQTMTKRIFEGAIAAQRPVIVGAIQNDLRQRGITLPDPDRFFDLFMDEFIDEFTQSMQDQSASIYLDRFTAAELAEIAAFYKTPAGQSLVAATPDLMMAGAEMGQRAGMQAGLNAGRRLADRIESEGLLVIDDPSLTQQLLDALR